MLSANDMSVDEPPMFPVKNLSRQVPQADLIADLQRLAAKLPHLTITRDLYRGQGTYSEAAWTSHFGKWPQFMAAAGLNQDKTQDEEPQGQRAGEAQGEAEESPTLLSYNAAEYLSQRQKEEFKEIKANSDKWINLEQSVLVPLAQQIEKFAPEYQPFRVYIRKSREDYAVVLAPFDLHFGKYVAYDEWGNHYNMDEARALLIEHTLTLVSDINDRGRPEKIILGLGSDYLHIDTENKTTTQGTPQDTDGSYHAIFTRGAELAVEQIDLLRQIAPVEVLKVNGNHDFASASALMVATQYWFRNCEDVTFNTSPNPRQYSLYGETLLGFGHGDTVKPVNLISVMNAEAPHLWNQSKLRYFFTGHLHHETRREINGITHIQLASLAPADHWHKKQGLVTSRRSLQAFAVTKTRGIAAEYSSLVKDPQNIASGVKIRRPN